MLELAHPRRPSYDVPDDAQRAVSFVTDCNEFVSLHLDKLAKLRQGLHAHPEHSNKETKTTKTLITFLKGLENPPEILANIGGGFMAVYDFNTNNEAPETTKTVVFRCELDAVTVSDALTCDHKSTVNGLGHKCGHDGHMAIVIGLAKLLSDFHTPSAGRVALLFQPAEETGEGARQMVETNHPVLSSILESPTTTIFALHNVPGYPVNSIILPRANSFACASQGVHIKLTGSTCHASQPHMGKNPTMAMCNIINVLAALPSTHMPFSQKSLITIVGAKAGGTTFGVSAGDAEIMVTMRSTTDTALRLLAQKASKLINGIAAGYGLQVTIEYVDPFAATINDPVCAKIVKAAAEECGLDVLWQDEAFPWSEDFGVFLQRTHGAMFGLGVGTTHEPLHGELYDFPDSEILNGVNMFATILHRILDCQD